MRSQKQRREVLRSDCDTDELFPCELSNGLVYNDDMDAYLTRVSCSPVTLSTI